MTENTKLNIVLGACAIIGAIGGKWAISKFFNSELSDKKQLLIAAASEINESLPMNIDSETVLFSTSGSTNRFTYNYELVSHQKSEMNIEQFTNAMNPMITNAVCTKSSMQGFRDLDIVVSYKYFDSSRQEITTIDVDTTQCATEI
jgi:hypothetical protein